MQMERRFYIEEESGKPVIDYLLAIKYDARSTTLQRLKNLTQEELDWQPYEGWNSIGALLSHIIAGDRYFKAVFIEERELTEIEKQAWMPGMDLGKYVSELQGKPLEYYIDELTNTYLESKEAIKNISVEKLLERRFDTYDKVKGSDLAWVLYHGAEDEVHHRGQISILRKLYKMRTV
ncbi:MAG: hypothetical protein JWO06_2795 [Bacteroidota bacterium]|nr:hypothetical protein [Bacteroidota bacterium]